MSLVNSREAESRGRTSTNLRSVSGGTRICLGAFPGPFPFPSPRSLLSPFETCPASSPFSSYEFLARSPSHNQFFPSFFPIAFFSLLSSPSLALRLCVYIYVYRPEAAHPRAQSVHRTVDRETFDLTAKPDRQKAFFCGLEEDGERKRRRKRAGGGGSLKPASKT